MSNLLKRIARAVFGEQKACGGCGRMARASYDGYCFSCRGRLGEHHER